jgi:ribulose-bisphosphate carboxylase large chain
VTRISTIGVVYRVRGEACSIEARAAAIAVEQSVEMPPEAIDDPQVLDGIIGRVEDIADRGGDVFDIRIALATATTGPEAGQLINMLFGNTSIHDDVELLDVDLPADVAAAFGGPNVGLEGLRARAGAGMDGGGAGAGRALTCSALKPQGLPSHALADLAGRLALGGLDFIKDDHGLADQAYSPFAGRVPACAAAVRAANAATGGRTRYLPSLSGDLDRLRRQVALARDVGLDTLLIAPLVVGLPAFHTLVRDNPDMAFMAHPAMAGAARIAPPLLIGRLFRLFGADAVVFPNHGGRFGYSPETCQRLARVARAPWHGLRPAVPVPAGGMSLERVPEIIDFYGPDTMLLIGGSLLAARGRLTEETAAFTGLVRTHGQG